MTPHDIRNLAYTLTEADDYNIAMSNFARAELERLGISEGALYAFLIAVADFAETQEGRIV